MLKFLIGRLATMLLTMLCTTFIVFFLVNLEPNLVRLAKGQINSRASDAAVESWLDRNGYRAPLLERYGAWLGVWPRQPIYDERGRPTATARNCPVLEKPAYAGVLQGYLGCSTRYKEAVGPKILEGLKATGVLMFWVMIVMVPSALLIGVLAGMREGSRTDRGLSVFSILTTSTPEYVSGIVFTIIFASWLGVLNGSAATATTKGVSFYNFTLPVMTMALYGMGYIARMTRASMAEVMTSQYIRTARLKGLSFRLIVWRHALRNALIAPFTVIMLQFPWLLTGVVIVEVIFRYRGFGWMLVEAAGNNDIELLLACSTASVMVVLITQLISDVGYVFLNPRIRVQ
ncbi:MAG: ABC transporter permease [Neomegalonema sp.]|nr:ABC transporter permease [Neomegalonema sp.]